MKISIIIPIFNSEKYLKECINSVLQQDYTDFEIILINDGSSDNSATICEEYVKKYKNIKLYSQKNQGVSAARNYGLNKAKGKYIFFLDSDDTMCSDMLSSVDMYLNDNTDLLIGNIVHWNTEQHKEYIETNTKFITGFKNIYDICEAYALKEYQIPWNPYQSIWRRDVIVSNNVYFDTKLTVGEDCDFFFNFIKYVQKLRVLNINFVKHRVDTSGSLVKRKTYKNIFSQLVVFNKLIAVFSNNDILKKYFADKYVSTMFQIELLSERKDKDKCYRYVYQNINNLDYINTKISKYFIFSKLKKVIGIKRSVKVFNVLRTVNHHLKNKAL